MKIENTAAHSEAPPAGPVRTLPFISSWALASLLLAGCGGGGNDVDERALATPLSAATATVRLEGCVVGSEWVGAADIAVHVRSADGRTIGTAFTNSRGVYALTVPARSAIVVDTTVAGPGGLTLNTGSTALTVGACLLADQ